MRRDPCGVLTYRSSGRVRRVFPDGGRYGHGRGADDHGSWLLFGRRRRRRRLGVYRGTGLGYHRVESVHRIRRVVDRTNGAVGLHQTVLASDHVAGPHLRLVLDVARGRIVHAILVSVADDRRLFLGKSDVYLFLIKTSHTQMVFDVYIPLCVISQTLWCCCPKTTYFTVEIDLREKYQLGMCNYYDMQ